MSGCVALKVTLGVIIHNFTPQRLCRVTRRLFPHTDTSLVFKHSNSNAQKFSDDFSFILH